MSQEWITVLLGPFQQLLGTILGMLPAIASAILLLLIGMVVARLIRTAIEKFFALIHIDEYTEKIKLNELLSRLGFGRSPAFVIGFLVYWLIILVFLVSAANAVQLTVVSQLLQRFVLFIPKLISAILVAAGGLLLGHFLAEVVRNAAVANKLDGAVALGKIARFTVLVFAVIMALEQVGIDTSVVTSSVQIILAAIGLGLALAFGLGGRDVAAAIIKDWVSSRGQGGRLVPPQ